MRASERIHPLLEKPEYTVRTPLINPIIELFTCESNNYDGLKIERDEKNSSQSDKGGHSETLRTHAIALLQALAS